MSIEDKLEELENVNGQSTELVSLILPEGYKLSEAKNLVNQELMESENIKDKKTRKNVQTALKKVNNKLKQFNTVPENGVGVFAGNTRGRDAKSRVETWVVQPEQGIASKLYRCDKKFHTAPIRNVVGSNGYYIVAAIDRDVCAFGRVNPETISVTLMDRIFSNIPSKHGKGGQSARRYERFIEKRKESFLNDTSERLRKTFLDEVRSGEALGMVLAGPGLIKQELRDNLHNEISSCIVNMPSTSYSGRQGLKQAVENTASLTTLDEAEQFDVCKEFLEEVDGGKATYGREMVEKAVEYGAVSTLLVPEGRCV